MNDNAWILCFNCGKITHDEQWQRLVLDLDTDEIRPARDGEYDPVLVCPGCDWHHTDDDSNPGIAMGTFVECADERYESKGDWADFWEETNAEGVET